MTNSEEDNNITYNGSFLEEREKVLELARVNELEILDVGTGPLCIIAAKNFDCFVTSIDTDSDKLSLWEETAEKEGVSEKISFEKEDTTALSYCNDAFDVGICFGALHHIPVEKREKALSEISRVSYERFIVADFTPEGFLELHGGDDFAGVDLKWLENTLLNMGSLKTVPLGKLNAYIVEKEK